MAERLSDLARRMARVESLNRTQSGARSAREVGNVERAVNKVFLRSPNGSAWELTVADDGTVTTTKAR